MIPGAKAASRKITENLHIVWKRNIPVGAIMRLRDNLGERQLSEGFKPGDLVMVEELKIAEGQTWVLVKRHKKLEWGHFDPTQLRVLRTLELLALMADL